MSVTSVKYFMKRFKIAPEKYTLTTKLKITSLLAY
jgi:hypothetical protein